MVLSIQLIDAATVGGCVGGYTEYELSVYEDDALWTVRRRFKEFLQLDQELRDVAGYKPVDLPPKGMMGFRHRCNIGSFNSSRKEALQEYLSNMVGQVQCVSDVRPVAMFLARERQCQEPANGQPVSKDELVGVFNRIDPLEKFGLPMPVFMLPLKDLEAENHIVEVAFGESKDMNGVEVTVFFKDEDRPSHVQDVVYDAIRKPLFGRSKDIETFTFVRGESGSFESIHFKGTYSGEQDWSCGVPAHMTETVRLEEFSKAEDRTVLWVNVWNHLFGPRNNNSDMEMVRIETYACTAGTRAEVDSRYRGFISSVA